jgi:hypothetical protein
LIQICRTVTYNCSMLVNMQGLWLRCTRYPKVLIFFRNLGICNVTSHGEDNLHIKNNCYKKQAIKNGRVSYLVILNLFYNAAITKKWCEILLHVIKCPNCKQFTFLDNSHTKLPQTIFENVYMEWNKQRLYTKKPVRGCERRTYAHTVPLLMVLILSASFIEISGKSVVKDQGMWLFGCRISSFRFNIFVNTLNDP